MLPNPSGCCDSNDACCDVFTGNLSATITPVSGCGCTTPVSFPVYQQGPPEGRIWANGYVVTCGVARTITVSCGGAGVWYLGATGSASTSVMNEVPCPDILLHGSFDASGCLFDIEVTR